MKQLVLTGLATEHNFNGGGESFFLVFNNGELRIPITQEATEIVIKEMYSGPTPEQAEEVQTTNGNGQSYQISNIASIDDDNERDEAGIGQV